MRLVTINTVVNTWNNIIPSSAATYTKLKILILANPPKKILIICLINLFTHTLRICYLQKTQVDPCSKINSSFSPPRILYTPREVEQNDIITIQILDQRLTSSVTHPISGPEPDPSREFSMLNFANILALMLLPDSTLSITGSSTQV